MRLIRKLMQIDAWILDRAQPIANSVHAATGRNVRIQTRILRGMVALSFFIMLVEHPHWLPSPPRHPTALIVFLNVANTLLGKDVDYTTSGMRNVRRISPVHLILRGWLSVVLAFSIAVQFVYFTAESRTYLCCFLCMLLCEIWDALDVLPTRPIRHRQTVPVAIWQRARRMA